MRSIKLMADYQCHPIWNMSPGEYGDIDPSTLPISHDLKTQLMRWAHAYDATLNMDDPARSGFQSEEEEAEFKTVGKELGERLRDELGPGFTVSIKI